MSTIQILTLAAIASLAYVALAAAAAYAAIVDGEQSYVPRIGRRYGDQWPTHKARARNQRAARRARHREAIRRRRRAARGHRDGGVVGAVGDSAPTTRRHSGGSR
ncbi:hypothetical protein [Gordonia malaquae]|uniref:hypothetical protein n=1 Tax=Gordonia malaquae TaxID=410332 RepID=UPI00301A2437